MGFVSIAYGNWHDARPRRIKNRVYIDYHPELRLPQCLCVLCGENPKSYD